MKARVLHKYRCATAGISDGVRTRSHSGKTKPKKNGTHTHTKTHTQNVRNSITCHRPTDEFIILAGSYPPICCGPPACVCACLITIYTLCVYAVHESTRPILNVLRARFDTTHGCAISLVSQRRTPVCDTITAPNPSVCAHRRQRRMRSTCCCVVRNRKR